MIRIAILGIAGALLALSLHAEERVSASGRYCIAFDPPAGGWPLNKPVTVLFRLSPSCAAQGSLPDDLALQIDAAMPAHRHGSNLVPQVQRMEGNSFRISGLLMHMTGEWQLKVTLTSRNVVDEIVIPVVLD